MASLTCQSFTERSHMRIQYQKRQRSVKNAFKGHWFQVLSFFFGIWVCIVCVFFFLSSGRRNMNI